MIDAQSSEPEVFFKYRTDSSRTEEIVQNQKVWLSAPSQLNDPFECRIGEIPLQWKRVSIRQLEEAQIMGVISTPPSFKPPTQLFSLSPRETKQWLKRFRNNRGQTPINLQVRTTPSIRRVFQSCWAACPLYLGWL